MWSPCAIVAVCLQALFLAADSSPSPITPPAGAPAPTHVAIVTGCDSHFAGTTSIAHALTLGKGKYRVTFLTSEECGGKVKKLGCTLHNTGRWYIAKQPGSGATILENIAFGGNLSYGVVHHPAEAMESLIREDPPDVVINDFFTVGAAVVAEAHNIPLVNYYANGAPHYRVIDSGYPLRVHFLDKSRPQWMHDIGGSLLRVVMQRMFWVFFGDGMQELSRLATLYSLPPRSQFLFDEVLSYPNFIQAGEPIYQQTNVDMVTVTGLLPEGPVDMSQVDEELMSFVRTSEKPILYVAMGTGMVFSDEVFHIMKRVLETQEHFNVIWAHSNWKKDEKFNNNKLIIRNKMPQRELFALDKIVAFMTHCGLSSTLEGIRTGKALIAVPFGRDQFEGAGGIVRSKAGVAISSSPTYEEAMGALTELHSNLDAYRKNVVKIKGQMTGKDPVGKFWKMLDELAASKKITVKRFEHSHTLSLLKFLVPLLLVLFAALYVVYKFVRMLIPKRKQKTQ